MSDYSIEEEQLESLKKWWKSYGTIATTVVVGVCVATVGWRYYEHHQTVKLESASAAYQGLQESIAEDDRVSIATKANALVKDYAGTVYGTQASLVLAQQAIKSLEFEKAHEHLAWVLKHSADDALKTLAQMRQARLYAEQGEYDKAETTMTALNGHVTPALLELKGDIHFAKGEKDDAKKMYLEALASAKEKKVRLPFVEVKLEDLGVFVHESA